MNIKTWQERGEPGHRNNEVRMKEEIAELRAELAKLQEPIAWGVDWGTHGDRTCVSIIKKHTNGTIEVIATEYEPTKGK